MGEAPEDPTQAAADLQAAQVGHRKEGADHGHAAEVGELKGRVGLALALRQDVLGHPAPHLHRWTGHAGEGFAIAGVAVAAEVPDDADLAVALD